MLPENLFIHLIDTNLQNRIAECKDMDKDATEALSHYWTRNLHHYEQDWRIGQQKNLETKMFYFSKARITFQKMKPCNDTLQECFMTTKQQDILESYKHTMLSGNITGSRVYVPLSKTMYRGVVHVNNSKLTDTFQNQHFYLWKGQNQRDPLPIAPWISSRTFHYQKGLTPSWLWSIKVLVRG